MLLLCIDGAKLLLPALQLAISIALTLGISLSGAQSVEAKVGVNYQFTSKGLHHCDLCCWISLCWSGRVGKQNRDSRCIAS